MDAMALSLVVQAKGGEQAKRMLGEIDLIGKNIAKNFSTNFTIVGSAADKSAAHIAQTFARTSSSVTSSFARIGTKATGVAAGIAAMGDVGASSLQKIVQASSSVAFGFGPQGALVAAAGVAALAIVGIFTRAREEMKKTVEASRAWLESLDQSTAISTAKALNDLSQGRRFAKDPFDRLGIQGLERRRRELEASIAATPRTMAAGTMHSVESEAAKALRAELDRVTAALAEKNERMKDGLAILQRQGGVEGGITIATNLREAAERAAAKTAQEAAQVREREAERVADLALAFSNAEFYLRGLNVAEEVSLNISKKAAAAARERAAALLGPKGPGGYLNPGEGTGPFVLPAAGLQADMLEQWKVSVNDQFANVGQEVGMTFGESISGAFKAMGKTVLAGLGSIFKQMGQSLLQYGLVMKGLLPSLSNPFTSGFAAIAAGVALMALGGALGGIAQGRGGYGGAGGGYYGSGGGSYGRGAEELTKIILMPSAASESNRIQPAQPIVFNTTIIGPHDPAAQRQITEMVERGLARSNRKIT
jgi:hypothetical protein